MSDSHPSQAIVSPQLNAPTEPNTIQAVTELLQVLPAADEDIQSAPIMHAVFETLYTLTADTDLSLAGVVHLYELMTPQDRQPIAIEHLSLSETTVQLLSCLRGLKRQRLIFDYDFQDTEKNEGLIRMLFVAAQGIQALLIEIVCRLELLMDAHLMGSVLENPDYFALETFKIYVPICNRLGLWTLKWKLEDFSFRHLYPSVYRQIAALLSDNRRNREDYMNSVILSIQDRLLDYGLQTDSFEVLGRTKNIYSIYAKMKQLYCKSRGTSPDQLSIDTFNAVMEQHGLQRFFEPVYDLFGIRVLCESIPTCYAVLGTIHQAFLPVKTHRRDGAHVIDYIATPKPNGYQSIHTVVQGPQDKRIEIQIRTFEMNVQAEYGVAAHWKYKEFGSAQVANSNEYIFAEIKKLISEHGVSAAQDFLLEMDTDLFDAQIYLFTPKGDIISLPNGATPVDFAYRIHTEVGNHCYGARVNGRMATLDSLLYNGDIVEVMTQNSAHPSLDWLNFVATNSAKNRIRQWVKKSQRTENIERGRSMLEKALGKAGLETLLKSEPMGAIARRCNYQTPEDLLAGLGYGEITVNAIVNRIRELEAANTPVEMDAQTGLTTAELERLNQSPPKRQPSGRKSESPIIGVEGLVYNLAGCCCPVPGEPITGLVTLGNRGISIHRQGCHNLDSVPQERWITVSWNANRGDTKRPTTYPVEIQLEVVDRVGVLKDILTRLSDSKVNVYNAQVKTSPGQSAFINLGIDIENREQLNKICSRIRQMRDVLRLKRMGQVEE